jgi:RluA family pseudouridine synthase
MDLVKDGAVIVNGVRGKPGTTLRGDERLGLPPMEGSAEKAVPRDGDDVDAEPEAGPRREPGAVVVIHRDEDLLVVSKPPGVPCHAGAGLGVVKTLLELLKDDVLAGFGLAHRIDKDTSGLVALVRDAGLRAKTAEAFAADDVVEKVYDALVEGTPREAEGTIEFPLSEPGHGTKGRVDHARGKASRTDYVVVERFLGASRLRVMPKTGRTHQIRLHLEAIGTPLLVDPQYGRRRGWRQVDPKGGPAARLLRTPLHASMLTLPHPRTGVRMTFHAPLLADHRRTLEVLRVIAAKGGPPAEDQVPEVGTHGSDSSESIDD